MSEFNIVSLFLSVSVAVGRSEDSADADRPGWSRGICALRTSEGRCNDLKAKTGSPPASKSAWLAMASRLCHKPVSLWAATKAKPTSNVPLSYRGALLRAGMSARVLISQS